MGKVNSSIRVKNMDIRAVFNKAIEEEIEDLRRIEISVRDDELAETVKHAIKKEIRKSRWCEIQKIKEG